GDYSSVENARAQDPEADKMRYRNYITIVESNLITARREQEAINWEMNRRYGRSKELRVVIDSWRDVDDQLWRPNTLIPINIPIFGLEDKQWLLS
ncbi:phage tail protein, partial [Vibrio parahaemolyticus]